MMQQSQTWGGLPYYPISQFYKTKFGEKVYKIPVSTATTCPNREGLNGMKTCNFCDVWGSAAYPEIREKPLREQILETREKIRDNFKAQKFLVYFQAYTNTFTKVAQLRAQFEVLNEFDDVVGVVVGTRPDCLSDAVYDLWNEISQKMFLSVELGVQSFNEEQLVWMRRGHTAERSIQAIHRIKAKCPNVDLGIHLMFGQPGETDEQIIESAKLVNSLPIDNVKLHNLHVLKNTPLEQDFLEGKFTPVDKLTYLRRCKIFLTHLSPRVAVHRLAALSNRPEELVAPDWTARKMEMYQSMLDYMNESKSTQGQLYV